jgi:hypothetical protein
MSSIGSQTLTFLRGTIPLPKLRCVKWEVPGLNGYGVVVLGYGDSQFSLQAVFYGSLNDCHAAAYALELMQGTIQSLETDLGQTNSRVLLETVHPPNIVPWRIPGTTVTNRMETEIKCCVV